MNIDENNVIEIVKAKAGMDENRQIFKTLVSPGGKLHGTFKDTEDEFIEWSREYVLPKVFEFGASYTVFKTFKVVASDVENAKEILGEHINSVEGFVSGSIDSPAIGQSNLDILNLNTVVADVVTTFRREVTVDLNQISFDKFDGLDEMTIIEATNGRALDGDVDTTVENLEVLA